MLLQYTKKVSPLRNVRIHVHVGGFREYYYFSKNQFLVKIDSIIVIYVQFYVYTYFPIYSFDFIMSYTSSSERLLLRALSFENLRSAN